MEWIQVFTIIVTFMGGVFIFYRLTRDEIAVIREDMKRMDDIHRKETKEMREAHRTMDAKWELLFERLLLQDQQKKR